MWNSRTEVVYGGGKTPRNGKQETKVRSAKKEGNSLWMGKLTEQIEVRK